MFKLENKSELKPRQLEEDADFHEYLEDEQNWVKLWLFIGKKNMLSL